MLKLFIKKKKQKNSQKLKVKLKTRWRYFKEMITGIPDEEPNCPAFHTWQNYDDWDYNCELGGFKNDNCVGCKLRFLPNFIMNFILIEARKKSRKGI